MSQVGLAEAIEQIRQELAIAQDAGTRHQFRFEVTDIEVEFLVEMRKEGGANAKAQIWVVSAGADGSASGSRTHRVMLRLNVTDAATGRNLEVNRHHERSWDE
jgi:hypothetical protein